MRPRRQLGEHSVRREAAGRALAVPTLGDFQGSAGGVSEPATTPAPSARQESEASPITLCLLATESLARPPRRVPVHRFTRRGSGPRWMRLCRRQGGPSPHGLPWNWPVGRTPRLRRWCRRHSGLGSIHLVSLADAREQALANPQDRRRRRRRPRPQSAAPRACPPSPRSPRPWSSRSEPAGAARRQATAPPRRSLNENAARRRAGSEPPSMRPWPSRRPAEG